MVRSPICVEVVKVRNVDVEFENATLRALLLLVSGHLMSTKNIRELTIFEVLHDEAVPPLRKIQEPDLRR